MFCKNCGIEVQNGWVKCPKCGTAISDEVREQLKVTQKPEMYRTTWKDRLKFQLKVRLCIGAVLLVMMVIVIIIMAITEMFQRYEIIEWENAYVL